MENAITRSAALLLTGLLLDVSHCNALTVTNVSAGGEQTLYIKSDGSLWSTGYRWWHYPNGGGGQGMGSSAPEQLVPNGVTGCAAGIGHSLLIKSDGTLWGMGYNWSGQLGDGGTNLYYYYSARLIASDVVAAAAGNAHSLFVQANGSLWVMGDNANGELGDGTTNASHAAKEILASEVTAVAAGLSHSLFLKSDGSVWGMGANAFGQLGDGTTNSSFTPKQIIGADVIAISAGEYHSLFLESDGSLWATGWNERGQLGVGTNDNVLTPRQIVGSDVKAVVGGGRHTLFLRTDGSLWGMGYAHLGQLGDGALLFDVKTPTQILSNGVTVIASGSYHSLFVKEDGTLWGMGNDYYGELGGGLTRDKRVFPVLVSPRVTFTATPKVGVSPLSVQFTAPGTDSEGNAVNAWSWNFGDGSASVAQNPSHVYASTNSNFLNNSPVFVPALTRHSRNQERKVEMRQNTSFGRRHIFEGLPFNLRPMFSHKASLKIPLSSGLCTISAR